MKAIRKRKNIGPAFSQTKSSLHGRLANTQVGFYQAFKQSEQKLRRFIEESRDAIVLANENGLIVEWNPSAEKAYGLQHSQVLGKPLWDIQYQMVVDEAKSLAVYDRIRSQLQKILQQGDETWLNNVVETEIQPPQGARRTIQAIAFSIRTNRGFMLASVARDITERKMADQSLRRQMDELTGLNDVARASVEATSVEELIHAAAQAISQRLYTDIDLGVGLVDEAAKVLQIYRIEAGKSEELKIPLGQGITGRVLASGQPVLISDLSAEPDYVVIDQPKRSELCVPLKGREHIIGVINLESDLVDAFDQADEQLMVTFAGQLAVAIEKNRLYLNALNLADRRAIFYRAAQEVSASLALEQVFAAIHRAAEQLMPSDDFIIAMLDKEREEIETVYLVENGQRLPTIHFPASKGLAGYVIATNRSLKFDDFENENVQIQTIRYGVNETRSYLFVPLRVKGQAIGAISVQSYSAYVYSRDDQEVLEMLASQAAIAIENARLFAEVQQLATIDPLTGVFNRRHFFNMAQHEIERARRYNHPLTAIMLDIDNFKKVNDSFGHATGDLVLQAVATRCRSQLRDTDIFCRYGGEEFTILLPDTDLERARVVAERLRLEVEQFRMDPQIEPMGITISLGIAAFSSQSTDIDVLLKMADQALYAAKSFGRNQLRVYNEG